MKLALNEDLRYYSYKRCRGQLLTEKTHENRSTKGTKLLSKVKHPAEPQTIWIFSDEKDFCQEQKRNTQNNRWLPHSPNDTPRVMQTKSSQTVMVFGCVSCEGDVMPPHFFREGHRFNSDAYVELLITVVKPWITKVANGRPYVWKQDSSPCHTSDNKGSNGRPYVWKQDSSPCHTSDNKGSHGRPYVWKQDSSPCHTSVKSQKWLLANLYDYNSPSVWPPNSPDLNPMDYYVWGAVEKEANRRASTTRAQLINRIKAGL